MKSQSQAAYEKWCETFTIEAVGNAALIAALIEAATKPWDELPKAQQERWLAIAEAIIEVYEDPEQLGPITRDMDPEEFELFKQRFEAARLTELSKALLPDGMCDDGVIGCPGNGNHNMWLHEQQHSA
ncbi:MAG TPA: hypothetical protein VMP68_31320 [Candidatus Eisenbacteria bacterium]|nr:hypothetical protein [Candidatus Eisenbacteria bacterium]